MAHTIRIAYPETITDRPASLEWAGSGTLADAIAATLEHNPGAIITAAADLRGLLPGGIA